MKTLKFDNVEIRTVFENKKVEKNSITENEKFEQIGDETIQKHIKNSFFSSVSNSIRRKNFLRICRIVNLVDYKVQNFAFYQTRYIFHTSIFIFGEIFQAYKQLLQIQFLKIFVQVILLEIVEKANQNELNKIE